MAIAINQYPAGAKANCPECNEDFPLVANIHQMIRDNAALLKCPHCQEVVWVDNDSEDEEDIIIEG